MIHNGINKWEIIAGFTNCATYSNTIQETTRPNCKTPETTLFYISQEYFLLSVCCVHSKTNALRLFCIVILTDTVTVQYSIFLTVVVVRLTFYCYYKKRKG